MAANKPRLPILNRAHSLADGLTGAWLMYEGAGSTTHELIHGMDGTLGANATWARGSRGPVIDGDGTAGTGRVTVPYASYMNNQAAGFSFFILYNVHTYQQYDIIAARWQETGNQRIWALSLSSATSIRIYLSSNGIGYTSGAQSNSFTIGTWNTFAFTQPAASTSVTLYSNGQLNGVLTSALYAGTCDLTFLDADTFAGSANREMDGRVGVALMYNRELDAREVAALHVDPYVAFRGAPLWVPAFTPGGGAPTAPSDLTATATGATTIDLAWTDNSGDETGFKIERGTDGVIFAQIDTAAADATSYNDTGLSAGTLYYYRVRAYNGSGDSAYSNTASDTTLSDFMPRHGAVMLSSGVAMV